MTIYRNKNLSEYDPLEYRTPLLSLIEILVASFYNGLTLLRLHTMLRYTRIVIS